MIDAACTYYCYLLRQPRFQKDEDIIYLWVSNKVLCFTLGILDLCICTSHLLALICITAGFLLSAGSLPSRRPRRRSLCRQAKDAAMRECYLILQVVLPTTEVGVAELYLCCLVCTCIAQEGLFQPDKYDNKLEEELYSLNKIISDVPQ